jgi:hypothetical protein
MSDSVKIHEIVKQNLKGAVLIDGFPSVGLVGTIVATKPTLGKPSISTAPFRFCLTISCIFTESLIEVHLSQYPHPNLVNQNHHLG